MLNVLILVVLFAIVVSLGGALFFLIRDRGETNRTVLSLSIRVALAIFLLALLAFGFAVRYLTSGITPG